VRTKNYPMGFYGHCMTKLWTLAHGCSIALEKEAILVGVLNVTPDSFSDGGHFTHVGAAIAAAKKMQDEGAHIIDIGGESTRPDATPIDEATETARLMPVLDGVLRHCECLVSVDTYRSTTARRAIAAGAHIINDVWGLQKDPSMAQIVADTGAGIIIMHTGRERVRDKDVIRDQQFFFYQSLALAKKAGIAPSAIMLDPGFGFAKDVTENVDLMRRADELHQFGLPLMAGTSRKRFVGYLAAQPDPAERDSATAATSLLLRQAGFAAFRVHNVRTNRDVLNIVDAIFPRYG